MPTAKKKDGTLDDILEISRGVSEVHILGLTPTILNRLSEKTKRELLFPPEPVNRAARQMRLKHDPIREFRASPYEMPSGSPTAIGVLAAAFKRALGTAALDIPGASKAQIGRLTWVEGHLVGLYGLPKIFIAPVRSADIAHTPDIRTRMIVPEWACSIVVSYATPLVRPEVVQRLLASAGLTVGIGDWRPEKGAGNYGQYELVNPDDERYLRVIATGGHDAQVAAIANPIAFDPESEDLLRWFQGEASRRGFDFEGKAA